jgi:hypothetical protein
MDKEKGITFKASQELEERSAHAHDLLLMHTSNLKRDKKKLIEAACAYRMAMNVVDRTTWEYEQAKECYDESRAVLHDEYARRYTKRIQEMQQEQDNPTK